MNSKIYIIVKKDLTSHKSVAIAHAVLMLHLKFKDDPIYQHWLNTSFKKVICEATSLEFQNLKLFDNKVIVTESALNGCEVALAFPPREDWPIQFKYLALSKY